MSQVTTVTIHVAGHFGELLQGTCDGEVVLLTLPCPVLGISATWTPDGIFDLVQPEGFLPEGWISPIFSAATKRAPYGQLTISANLRRGGGCGGSTAAIVAVSRALGLTDTRQLAALCHGLEGASDPLMLPDPGNVLWASRKAQVVRTLPPLPTFEVIGGHLGPPERTHAEDCRFPDISDLLRLLEPGVDREVLARISTASALRNAALRRPGWLRPLEHLLDDCGALGLVAAHTGSACGLLFTPGQADRPRVSALLAAAGVDAPLAFLSGGGA